MSQTQKKVSIKQAISQAKKAARQGNPTLALQLYQSVLQHQPDHAVAKKGARKIQKELPKSLSLKEQKLNPSQLQLNPLINLFQSGQLKKAESACRQLLFTFPRSIVVNNILGVVLKELGRLEEAVQAFDKTIKLKPDYAVAYSNRGVALQESGKLKQALASCDRAIHLDPNYAAAYCNRGVTLHALKKPKEAVQDYDRAIQLKPEYAEAYCNRGVTLETLGQPENAAQAYDRAIQLNPNYAEAYCNRGVTLNTLGQPEEAVQAFDRAIQLNSDYVVAYCNYGITLQELGRSDEALAAYDKAIWLKPDYAEAYFNRGVSLQALKQPIEALQAYDKAIQLEPDYAEAHCNRGVMLQGIEQPEAALAAYDRAIQLKPDYAQVYCHRGASLEYLGQLEEAVVWWERAIQLKPDYPKAFMNCGNVALKLGNLKEATEHYIKVTQLDPDYAQAYHCLGILKKYKSNDPHIGQMENLYERTGPDGKGRVTLCFALAKAYDDLGGLDKSFSYLQEGNRLRYKELNYDIGVDKRMITKIMEIFSAGSLARNVAPEGSLSKHPIFIVGMPRSGTTLVEQILASHSQVYGAGELEYMARLVHPILSNLLDQNGSQDSSKISEDEISLVRDGYLEALAELNVAEKIITDKMPLNFLHIGFILSTFPEAKIIHLNRDPRATCWSIYRHSFRSKGIGCAYDMGALAGFYRLYIELMSFWRERFPESIYDLGYEYLTENQEGETRKLLQFCDLEWEEQCLDFHKTKRTVITSSNVQVRKKMYKGSSEAWRKYQKHLQPLINELGY